MNKNIKIRKRRFFAFLLTILLVLNSLPLNVFAADFNGRTNEDGAIKQGDILYGGDTLSFSDGYCKVCIKYEDPISNKTVIDNVSTDDSGHAFTYTVLTYDDTKWNPTNKEDFHHWEVVGTEFVESPDIYTIQLQAVYVKRHNITYHMGTGETNPSTNPTSYIEGTGVTSFADATKQFYVFQGWYDSDSDSANKIESIGTNATTDFNLYPRFTPEEYNITYELDGGTNDANNPSSYKTKDGVAQLYDATKTNYSSGGWYTDSGFSSASKVEEIAVGTTGDITLYAKYIPDEYDIEYALNDGTNDGRNPAKYNYDEAVTSLYPATKDNYDFVDWYIDADFNTTFSGIPVNSTGKKTVYAKFTPKTYNITYELNNGTNDKDNPNIYTYGKAVTIKGASKTNYKFDGWYLDDKFTNAFSGITATTSGDLTLYAKFTPDKYKINYELYDGENNTTNPKEYDYEHGVDHFEDAKKDNHSFDGWYSTGAYVTKITEILSGSTGDVTLHAKYTPDSYNIIYKTDGGDKGSNPDTYTFGVGVPSFTDGTKTGHRFTGWYSSEKLTNKVESIPTDATGEKTLYAGFVPEDYDIEYVLNGGTNDSSNPVTYTYGTGVQSFKDASKANYGFTGWYDDSSLTNKITSIGKTETGKKTLYAGFTPNKYKITYVLNGGTNGSNPTEYAYGTGVSSFADASKANHSFDGWYSDAGFTTKVESIGTDATGEKTLYAKFTPNSYDIEYKLNGGTNGANPAKYTYGTGVASFKDASKANYDFTGWYDDSSLTNKVTSIGKTETGKKTLYAGYTPKKYSITYILNGGTNGSNPIEYTYGTGVPSFADATKANYSFDGWYSDADFKTKVESIGTDASGEKTLYAKFTPNSYDITYILDGGTNGANPAKYTYGIGVTKFEDATKENYDFAGWYGEEILATKVTSIGTDETGAKILYASFTPKKYQITYVLNGGTNDSSNPTEYTYNTGVSSFADAAKANHSFDGWYSDEGYTTKVTSIGSDASGEKTLYAKFTPDSYDIEYKLDGGTNGANPAKYTYGTGVTSFKDASKENYDFIGWYDDAAYTNKVTSIGTEETGKKTLYAKFIPKDYSISYELNGGTNNSANPSKYTYGTGVSSFEDAVKAYHSFNGWYSDADFNNKVTSIGTDASGDKKLYASFTPDSYKISYVLDGGTNDTANPTEYTYGVGVTSFKDASKANYDFGGWYSDSSFTTKVTAVSKTDNGDITLYAKFTPKKFEINYELDGGTNDAANPSEYTYGTGVSSFKDASKQNYKFDGWYSTGAYVEKVTSILADASGDKTLYAKFDPEVYKINYVLDGGTNSSNNPAEYTYSVGVASFEEAVKDHYEFDGWYSDPEFTDKIEKIGTTDSGEKTLYAKFVPEKYEIKYELDGGANSAENPVEYSYGIGVESFKDAVKDGYSFEGWYSDDTYSTKIESIGTTETGEVTLYAKFVPGVYEIKYELDGGTNSDENPVSYTFGIGVDSFKDAEKEHYSFEGWYADAEFSEKVEAIAATEFGDKTLYAKFIPDSYAITYELNGGTNASENPVTYSYGTGVASFKDAVKDGFRFEGWYADKDFTDEIKSISDTETGDKVLYAKWSEIKVYSIKYDLNGGTLEGKTGVITVEAEEGSVITIPAAPTRDGYKFTYWKGSEYHPGDSYTVEGNHTFTAQWEEITKTEPTVETTTEETKKVVIKDQPATGDASALYLLVSLFVISLLGICLIIKRKTVKK